MDERVFKGMTRDDIMGSFRDKRYSDLNKCRWDQFLSMGIDLKGKTIFEPGAGIGDQTEWLLDQGASHIYVNDGRPENLQIIRDRFSKDLRVSFVEGNLEKDEFNLFVDLIFCYGVYYHIRDAAPFRVMRRLSKIGMTIVMDYLAGNDEVAAYGYSDCPSATMTGFATRPRPETLLQSIRDTFGYAYEPVNQLHWVDPMQTETRLIAIGSHLLLGNSNLLKFDPVLTQIAI